MRAATGSGALCGVLLLVGQAAAQQAPAPDSAAVYALDSLQVSVTRGVRPLADVPRAVGHLAQADIQRGAATLSLAEALRLLPGVHVDNRHNLALGDRLTIRGVGSRSQFGVRGIKILVDGIPVTLPDGQAQLSNVDLGSAGRIQVLRGPSSSLYGNAAGGVVLVETESPPDAPLTVEPKLILGSHGLRKWQAKAAGGAAGVEYVANGSRMTVEGFREHAAAEQRALNVVARIRPGESTRVSAVLNVFDSPFAMNPSSLDRATADSAPATARSFVQTQGAGERGRQLQTGLTLRHSPSDAVDVEAMVYGATRSIFNPIPGRVIDLSRRVGGTRALVRLRSNAGGASAIWTAGVDLEAQRDERLELGNEGLPPDRVGSTAPADIPDHLRLGDRVIDQIERVAGIATFAELALALGSRWVLVGSARYDRYDFRATDRLLADGDDSGERVIDHLSPMLGAALRVRPGLQLYGNASTAFQTPTTSELSNRPDGSGGFNPELEPERLRGFEVGARGGIAALNLRFDLAAFLARVEDALIPFQAAGAAEEVFFRNAGRTRRQGIEALLAWRPVTGLDASIAYTWLDDRFEDFVASTPAGPVQLEGNRVPGVPPRQLTGRAAYRHDSGIFAEAVLRWTDDTYANDHNGPPPTGPASQRPRRDFVSPAHSVLDLRIGRQSDGAGPGLTIFAGVDNLLDARYDASLVPNAFGARYFEPAPGRTAYLGIALPFAPFPAP